MLPASSTTSTFQVLLFLYPNLCHSHHCRILRRLTCKGQENGPAVVDLSGLLIKCFELQLFVRYFLLIYMTYIYIYQSLHDMYRYKLRSLLQLYVWFLSQSLSNDPCSWRHKWWKILFTLRALCHPSLPQKHQTRLGHVELCHSIVWYTHMPWNLEDCSLKLWYI